MRRESRKREKDNSNMMLYLSGSILIIMIIAFIVTIIIYNSSKNSQSSGLTTEQIAELVPNESNTESASAEEGKTVEESKNELENNTINEIVSGVFDGSNNTTSNNTTNNTNSNTKTTSSEVTSKQKDPTFIAPIEGEVIKAYARDNLVFSNTLQEWTTHLGIDIKADKATVVKAAEDGTVIAIKNDPRYGLTIIIEHSNGFETLYANLLTTEFVKVGEKVKEGQTIGTVGNTAVFEIADATHLHFEIMKDNENVDPTIYINI